jgi:LysM domain
MNDHNNDPLQFDDDLAKHLAHRRVAIADPGVSTIVRAGRRRARRRRSAYQSFVAVTVLATGGVASSRFRSHDANIVTRPKSDQSGTDASSTGPQTASTISGLMVPFPVGPTLPELPASSIEWQRIDPTLAIGDSYGRVARGNDDEFLVVSTEPGRTQSGVDGTDRPTLYSSSDGANWTRRSAPDGIGLVDAMMSDGSMYAVGTAPSASASPAWNGDLVVAEAKVDATSSAAWKKRPLPFDPQPLIKKGAEVVTTGMAVAHRGSTTVVAATITVTANLAARLVSGGAIDAGFEVVGDSVHIFAPLTKEQLACQAGGDRPVAQTTIVPVPTTMTRRLDSVTTHVPVADKYIVKSGDTISNVASAMNVSLADLLDANGMTIVDANRVQPGWQLIVPEGGMMPAGGSDPTGPPAVPQPTTTSTSTLSAPTAFPTIPIAPYGAPTDGPIPSISPECQRILNAPPVVARTIKLVDLGVDPAVVAQIGDRKHVFVSQNGGAFEEVSMPADPTIDVTTGWGGRGLRVVTDNDGFTILLPRPSERVQQNLVYRSADGRAWNAPVVLDGQLQSFGVINGVSTAIVGGADESSTPASVVTFETREKRVAATDSRVTATFLAGNRPPAVGDAGMLTAVAASTGLAADVDFDLDGLRFIAHLNSDHTERVINVVDIATGKTLATDQPIDRSPVVEMQFGSGSAKRTISAERFYGSFAAASAAAATKSIQILDSVDGVSWSTTRLSDLIDIDAEKVTFVSNVLVDHDRLIISVHAVGSTDVPKTVTFVGRRKSK